MEITPRKMSRRTALQAMGVATAATGLGTATNLAGAPDAVADLPGPDHGSAVRLLLNGRPGRPGSYAFPSEVETVTLDNGLARFTFNRNDGLSGGVPLAPNASLTGSSVVVDGTELAHNLTGQTFYVDAWGGKSGLMCTKVVVHRVTPDLVEVAIVDDANDQLQHEHHLIMRRGRRGLYGYDIMTAPAATQINEVRMNTRWDRSIFEYAYNWERGSGQQPTYAYLDTQQRVQDETWRIDGVNNPDLPAPDSNSGNLPAGSVYSKYEWSLYHHQNPMFGHYGHGFGVWFTPLGGVTAETLCAFYGVGPTHQDLAIHQDAIILNYMGANHYGLPAYDIPQGYRRLYGPWYTFITTGDETDPETMITAAAATARAEIDENRKGSDWIADPLYPRQRTTVTGRVRLADGRSAADLWVLLSTQDTDEIATIHEPTYFVRTDAAGRFALPGIPPAWQPGSTTPGSYTLYVFSAGGPAIGQYKQPGITVSGRHQDLGTIVWAPERWGTHLWQIGLADRTGGEYAFATDPVTQTHPREYEKPATVPGDLTFTIGSSWEPEDWYYAQTNAGTWTITFDLDRVPDGSCYLTVATSMQQSSPPTVAVNGSAVTGTLPANNDSTIARQADRSGQPRTAVLSFPGSALQVGSNTITLTRGAGTDAGNGLGWDTLVLEADESSTPPVARLAATILNATDRDDQRVWRIKITNTGHGAARDVRLSGLGDQRGTTPVVLGRDPNRFPVPVSGRLAAGASVVATVRTDRSSHRIHAEITADGGLTRARI